MQFSLPGDVAPLTLDFAHCVVAGWTGRNRAAIDHHIEELAALGVAPPSAVPLYYRVSADLLTQADAVQVVGNQTSGEVEPLIVKAKGKLYLGLASDHTDRELEAHSVALSKQACVKPCASALWAFDDVAERLDDLVMRSWIFEGGNWVAYQKGTLAAIRPLMDLISGSGLEALAEEGPVAMLCGTFGVGNGGVRPASEFRMEIRDEKLDRVIAHQYKTTELPIIS